VPIQPSSKPAAEQHVRPLLCALLTLGVLGCGIQPCGVCAPYAISRSQYQFVAQTGPAKAIAFDRALSPAGNVGVERGRPGGTSVPSDQDAAARPSPLDLLLEPPSVAVLGVAADMGIVSQRAERAARILRFKVESRSSGAARYRT
jgi:hypothetical protein